jgi:hypothetical protein
VAAADAHRYHQLDLRDRRGLAGYETETGRPLDEASHARLVRAKVISALDHFVRHGDRAVDGAALRRFVTKRVGPAS